MIHIWDENTCDYPFLTLCGDTVTKSTTGKEKIIEESVVINRDHLHTVDCEACVLVRFEQNSPENIGMKNIGIALAIAGYAAAAELAWKLADFYLDHDHYKFAAEFYELRCQYFENVARLREDALGEPRNGLMTLKERKALWNALCVWRRHMDDRGWLFFTGTYSDCADRHARMVNCKDMQDAVSLFRWV